MKIVLEISALMSNLRPSTHAITFPPARYLIGAFGLRHICGKMIISLSMNITMNQLGGASVIAKFHS